MSIFINHGRKMNNFFAGSYQVLQAHTPGEQITLQQTVHSPVMELILNTFVIKMKFKRNETQDRARKGNNKGTAASTSLPPYTARHIVFILSTDLCRCTGEPYKIVGQ